MLKIQVIIFIWAYILCFIFIFFRIRFRLSASLFSDNDYFFLLFFLNSLSFRDIMLLAQSSRDETETIRQFYEWKHQSLSFVIKSILAFLLSNFALIIKLFLKNDKGIYVQDIDLQFILIIVSSIIILIEFFMIMRIRNIPQEYVDAINIYNALK